MSGRRGKAAPTEAEMRADIESLIAACDGRDSGADAREGDPDRYESVLAELRARYGAAGRAALKETTNG